MKTFESWIRKRDTLWTKTEDEIVEAQRKAFERLLIAGANSIIWLLASCYLYSEGYYHLMMFPLAGMIVTILSMYSYGCTIHLGDMVLYMKTKEEMIRK